MQLIILGSGTSTPHPRRASSSYWLETDSGSLLLDAGPSSIHQMAKENCDWANLDAVWISHFHLDHFGGLAPLLFGMKHAPQTQSRTKPLVICGPKGLKKTFDVIDAVSNHRLTQQPFQITFQEVEPNEVFEILPNLGAQAFKTLHTDESLALCVDDGKSSVVFTSDTYFDELLIDFAREADLLLIECSFVNHKPVFKHLNLAEAIYIANQAKVKKVVLTHFCPEWDDVDIRTEIIKQKPTCTVYVASDGLLLEI
jgi:ribonuclease BN (tRNA processing enzyme)